MSQLNRIILYKDKNASHFRVHFYIKSVFFGQDSLLQHFIQKTNVILCRIAQVSFLQVNGRLKKYVDLSVGFQNDNRAIEIFQQKIKVMLPSQNGYLQQHKMIASESFSIFCEQNKKPLKDGSGRKSSSSHNQSSIKKDDDYNDEKKRIDLKPINMFWIFYIPLQYKQRQILNILAEKGLKIKRWQWQMRQDMQFMQVQLTQPCFLKQGEDLQLKIQKYPLLAIPRPEGSLNQILINHELELNFQKEIDQVLLITIAYKSKGVLTMVHDAFYGPFKYVVVFATLAKLKQFQIQIQKNFKACRIDRPYHPVRPVRLEKVFNFLHLAQQILQNQESFPQN